jgi:hypothetical protein
MYEVRPISFREANRFVKEYHRHASTVQGWKFAVSLVNDQEELVGVGIAGRPVSATLQKKKLILEIRRVCVRDGYRNACSLLYGRLTAIGKLHGYEEIITYTLASENGSSLLAVGAKRIALVPGGGWDRGEKRRRNEQQIYLVPKIRWQLWPPLRDHLVELPSPTGGINPTRP